ncbi:MAG TPA: SGNH/GDSL hydrolase family protein [Parafilimonas sp.]|nr:SGNH/GDSL hydrolase family protein [Parafilimonas sp.]
MKKYIVFFLLLICSVQSFTQESITWYDPSGFTSVIDGRGWQTGLANAYDRLPAKAEHTVRPEVWGLSHNSAGEYINFITDANTIIVRYTVAGDKNMNHMPSTGVSGVDLYAQDIQNNWHWSDGKYKFGDTITYIFSNIAVSPAIKQFRLYLPLYNTPKWLQLGVAGNRSFSFIQQTKQPAIVLYGTSILQGGCASRPGLAWSNILGRKLNTPVINLGFSGNGRLELPVIELMNELNAALFVLDCQPNLTDSKIYSATEIETRIRACVKSLQAAHPAIPVLLTEHCCGLTAVNVDTATINRYSRTSSVLNKTFYAMQKEGVKNIYLLTAGDIGFDMESTVDGTHPNDIGMMKYANAYTKKITEIFSKQRGGESK